MMMMKKTSHAHIYAHMRRDRETDDADDHCNTSMKTSCIARSRQNQMQSSGQKSRHHGVLRTALNSGDRVAHKDDFSERDSSIVIMMPSRL